MRIRSGALYDSPAAVCALEFSDRLRQISERRPERCNTSEKGVENSERMSELPGIFKRLFRISDRPIDHLFSNECPQEPATPHRSEQSEIVWAIRKQFSPTPQQPLHRSVNFPADLVSQYVKQFGSQFHPAIPRISHRCQIRRAKDAEAAEEDGFFRSHETVDSGDGGF